MPMGIVSDADFDKELGNTSSVKSNGDGGAMPNHEPSEVGIVKDIERGRGKGNVEVPNVIRNLIGTEVVENGRQSGLELARNLGGISPSSVSAYSAGAVSTATFNDRPNLAPIDEVKEKIAKRARNKLMLALRSLTEETIASAKAKDIAGIAKDMSAIVRNMEPEKVTTPTGQGGPTFIFYSPRIRNEESFDVIDVRE